MKEALLYGVRPFWWVISSTQKYYDAYYATRKYSSDSKNKFLMRVIVREWEDKRLDREITLIGKVMYEVSPPKDLENLSPHPWISRKTWGFSLQSTSVLVEVTTRIILKVLTMMRKRESLAQNSQD